MMGIERRAEFTGQDDFDVAFARRLARRARPGVITLDEVRRIYGWLEYLEKRMALAKEIAQRHGSTSGAFANAMPIVHAQWQTNGDEETPRGDVRPSIDTRTTRVVSHSVETVVERTVVVVHARRVPEENGIVAENNAIRNETAVEPMVHADKPQRGFASHAEQTVETSTVTSELVVHTRKVLDENEFVAKSKTTGNETAVAPMVHADKPKRLADETQRAYAPPAMEHPRGTVDVVERRVEIETTAVSATPLPTKAEVLATENSAPISMPHAVTPSTSPNMPDAGGRYVMPAARRSPRVEQRGPIAATHAIDTQNVVKSTAQSLASVNSAESVVVRPTTSDVDSVLTSVHHVEMSHRRVDIESTTHMLHTRGTRTSDAETGLPRVMPRQTPGETSNTTVPSLPRVREGLPSQHSDSKAQQPSAVLHETTVVKPKQEPKIAAAAVVPALPHPAIGGFGVAASVSEQASTRAANTHAGAKSTLDDTNMSQRDTKSDMKATTSNPAAIDIDVLTDKVQRKIFRQLATEWERKGSLR